MKGRETESKGVHSETKSEREKEKQREIYIERNIYKREREKREI